MILGRATYDSVGTMWDFESLKSMGRMTLLSVGTSVRIPSRCGAGGNVTTRIFEDYRMSASRLRISSHECIEAANDESSEEQDQVHMEGGDHLRCLGSRGAEGFTLPFCRRRFQTVMVIRAPKNN